jgi:hypothetical protein
MGVPLTEVLARMSPKRQAKIKKMAEALIKKEKKARRKRKPKK